MSQGYISGHTHPIGSFQKNICVSSKNSFFSSKFSSRHFSLVYVPRDLSMPRNSHGNHNKCKKRPDKVFSVQLPLFALKNNSLRRFATL